MFKHQRVKLVPYLTRCITARLMVLCFALLAGCKPATSQHQISLSTQAVVPTGNMRSAMTDSVNYMHERGVKYTLYDLSTTPPTAIGGAIVSRLGTGGEKGCCISLPNTWRAGMRVRLDWHESDHDTIYEERSRELEIPRYAEPSDLYVVFYLNHEVEIVVSKGEPGHPEWRGRIKETPWEYCLAQNDRKVCKRATARIFDTASSQGFCVYLMEEKVPDGDNLCSFTMSQCMLDYEDEVFCKNILWGARRK